MTRSAGTPSAPTALRNHFKQHKQRPSQKDVPRLDEGLLERARNCVPHSEINNDLLEFIGDRCVNLVCALLTEDVKLSTTHHQTISRRITTNDTFGRIAYCLRLHEHAELTASDRAAVDDWDPYLATKAPPKVLADLFEAYAGAVYIQHGQKRLRHWLERIFTPIIKLATADYWQTNSWDQIYAGTNACRWRNIQPDTRQKAENRLLDHLDARRTVLKARGKEAAGMLPPYSVFRFNVKGELQPPDCDRVEVAEHLINMWICEIVIQHWPGYHHAKSKAAHLFSGITQLVTSERVMGFFAETLTLHKLCHPVVGAPRLMPGPYQYTQALRATIGWLYRADPTKADAWGLASFTPIVIRAHDILMNEHGYRPLVPKDHVSVSPGTSASMPRADCRNSDPDDDIISSLVRGVTSLNIRPDVQPMPRAITISITAVCNRASTLQEPAKPVAPAAEQGATTTASPQTLPITRSAKWTPVGKLGPVGDGPLSHPDPTESMCTTSAAFKEARASLNQTTARGDFDPPSPRTPKVVSVTQPRRLERQPKDRASIPEVPPGNLKTLDASPAVAGTPVDKENESPADATATPTGPTHITPVAVNLTDCTPTMFVPRSIRVKLKASAVVPS